jgi:predicted ABC-type ATPase
VLVYVVLSSADEAIRRVKIRVASGGHDVPEHKIRDRFGKSLQNLPWFWDEADRASVYFNGDAANRVPILVAEKVGSQHSFNPSVLLPLLAGR